MRRRRRLLSVAVVVPTAVRSLAVQSNRQSAPLQPALVGNWDEAKLALRDPKCCVVSIAGLEGHLAVLQKCFVDGDGPADLDLRSCVRVPPSSQQSTQTQTYDDCLAVRKSVVPLPNTDPEHEMIDPCAAALEELARGVVSLADGPLASGEGGVRCDSAFVRVVCASNYRARQPPYHTDKAPLRGYVTLCGVGTEYMTRPCSPMEYAALRTLGEEAGGSVVKDLKMAEELEFIVMKGDHYDCGSNGGDDSSSNLISWQTKLWKRASACVHRSPPGGGSDGGRRVIVSLDLGDGDDDREWYQAGTRREWRSGMTQRKSRLVA